MRKNAKPRSLGNRLARMLFTSVSTMAIIAGDLIIRNPVMAGGATAFLVVLGFVSANALWYQPEAHESVFFRTRPELVFKANPRPVLPAQAERMIELQANSQGTTAETTSAPQGTVATIAPERFQAPSAIPDTLPALAAGADVEIARLQQKLAALGLYSGTVDGFPGPQTRQALEQWKSVQERAGIKQADATPFIEKSNQQDDIAKAISLAVPTPRPLRGDTLRAETRRDNAHSETAALTTAVVTKPNAPAVTNSALENRAISSQDIVRVQAGLKAFGNDLVQVDGVPGKTTQDAIREFQKLFGLQVSGQVDTALISKMREIGLIS